MAKKAIIIAFVVLAAAAAVFAWSRRDAFRRETGTMQGTGAMKITSSAFEHDGMIPAEYTCDGQDASPPLSFSGVPDGAKSIALVVDDPDAPVGTWVHWTLWNIPPATRAIAAGTVPPGAVQGITSGGGSGYGGPCPPSGTHHYFFKAYALDEVLDLPATTNADGLERAMEGHILDKAGLIGLYSRGAR